MTSTPDKRLVILESPYAGDVERNVAYARRALADSLRRGEAPIASHLLYTQPGVLDDTVPAERRLGIDAGLAWGRVADATVMYADLGITPGMQQGIDRAAAEGRVVEVRHLDAQEQDAPLAVDLSPTYGPTTNRVVIDRGHVPAVTVGADGDLLAHVDGNVIPVPETVPDERLRVDVLAYLAVLEHRQQTREAVNSDHAAA